MSASLDRTVRLFQALIAIMCGLSAACGADVKPFETVAGWGTVVDPAGDCSFKHKNGTFKITVPGAYHDLWPVAGKVNAPLVLQDAQGDFTIQVQVAHIDKSEPNTMIECLASSSSFHAGTLVIWQNAKNLIRFDRTDMNKCGRAICSCYLHVFKDGERVAEAAPVVPDKPTHLRLHRRGEQITAAFSQDGGTTWRIVSSAHVDLPDNVKVGVSALNNTRGPCEVRFEELKITELILWKRA